jgi:hypothetical protein
MYVEENDAGGVSIAVFSTDDLSEVPEPHASLITDEIRAVFEDAPRYFKAIAKRSPFRSLTKWLNALISKGGWWLSIETGNAPGASYNQIGFDWHSKSKSKSKPIRGAIVGLPRKFDPANYPRGYVDFYSLLGFVDWMSLPYAGKLYDAGVDTPLSRLGYKNYRGIAIDPATTRILGDSPCGDMMIYTADDRGGWMCHENAHIHIMGSTADLINWVFDELLADRVPEYDYAWNKEGSA